MDMRSIEVMSYTFLDFSGGVYLETWQIDRISRKGVIKVEPAATLLSRRVDEQKENEVNSRTSPTFKPKIVPSRSNCRCNRNLPIPTTYRLSCIDHLLVQGPRECYRRRGYSRYSIFPFSDNRSSIPHRIA